MMPTGARLPLTTAGSVQATWYCGPFGNPDARDVTSTALLPNADTGG
ncbi:hypothetical protein G3I15_31325 [Streptomyces sp. SID10244]|nr:hypothetical protein [Streptomyces sp. SID10244]